LLSVFQKPTSSKMSQTPETTKKTSIKQNRSYSSQNQDGIPELNDEIENQEKEETVSKKAKIGQEDTSASNHNDEQKNQTNEKKQKEKKKKEEKEGKEEKEAREGNEGKEGQEGQEGKEEKIEQTNEIKKAVLCCPITLEPMTNPILLSDGYSYEKVAIESWMASKEEKAKPGMIGPLGVPLPSLAYMENRYVLDNLYKCPLTQDTFKTPVCLFSIELHWKLVSPYLVKTCEHKALMEGLEATWCKYEGDLNQFTENYQSSEVQFACRDLNTRYVIVVNRAVMEAVQSSLLLLLPSSSPSSSPPSSFPSSFLESSSSSSLSPALLSSSSSLLPSSFLAPLSLSSSSLSLSSLLSSSFLAPSSSLSSSSLSSSSLLSSSFLAPSSSLPSPSSFSSLPSSFYRLPIREQPPTFNKDLICNTISNVVYYAENGEEQLENVIKNPKNRTGEHYFYNFKATNWMLSIHGKMETFSNCIFDNCLFRSICWCCIKFYHCQFINCTWLYCSLNSSHSGNMVDNEFQNCVVIYRKADDSRYVNPTDENTMKMSLLGLHSNSTAKNIAAKGIRIVSF
jgi:hypothetical protein